MNAEDFDQYQVMVNGSRRLTRRNRRYLRLFTPFQPNMTVPCRTGGTSDEGSQLKFDGIRTSNSQQVPSMKNIEVMSTSNWGNAQHVEQ